MEEMKKSAAPSFPVTVTHLPVVRCHICRQTMAHRPGQVSAVLTEHYNKVHPERLGRQTDSSPDE
jgi:hypothetical protein